MASRRLGLVVLACEALVAGVLASGGCVPAAAPTAVSSVPPQAVKKAAIESSAEAKAAESRQKPALEKAITLNMQPATATLAPGDLGVQLTVEGPGPHGGRSDLTSKVKWTVDPADGVITIGDDGYGRPLGAGTATVTATYRQGGGEAHAAVKVTVTGNPAERPWDFAEDIVPLFTRAGCNAGGCHGKADGQNGFHLSIFGYDPEGDHRALTHESGGRRLSLMNPDVSLLLRKATGRTPHGGGQRITPFSDEYKLLRDWIAAGAPYLQGKTHGALAKVDVVPVDARLDEPGPRQLRVLAHYADGHERDVTRLASYRINDDSTASIENEGRAVLLRRAETDLIIRYRTSVLSTRLATLINPDLSFDFAALPRKNFIDDELFKRLESLRVPPSPPASDAAFLRRVSLDLTGEQPPPDQIRAFLEDKDTEKRTKLVDKLLASPDFVRFWEIKLGDMLQISNTRLGNGAYGYETWLRNRIVQNTPWDQIVYKLLTALGDPMEGPVQDPVGGPVNYALDGPDAKVKAEQAAQRFLGLRIRCAQCHDHPFDIWTQDDYFGLAAIFARAEQSGGMMPGAMMGRPTVKLNPKATVEHLRTKKPAEPRLLGGAVIKVADDEDPRKVLAEWMIKPDNPYFARAMANWVWAQFFGKGIADPPDDLSRANPPVHGELLDALAQHFIEHKFDLRDLIRTITTSEAYGMSSATVPGNEHDSRFFSHHIPRPLTAHQMADALAQATEVENRYPDRPRKTRAIDIPDPNVRSTILETFGRCTRTIGCASVATPQLSLRQALLLIGGDVIEAKVSSLNGYLSHLLAYSPEPEGLVENLYLRTVCRKPSAEELKHWSAELKNASSQREAAEDLFWALLNSREFAFNH